MIAGPEEINAMKRVLPSVRLKEEIEGLLGATAAMEEPPIVGFFAQPRSRRGRYHKRLRAFLGHEKLC